MDNIRKAQLIIDLADVFCVADAEAKVREVLAKNNITGRSDHWPLIEPVLKDSLQRLKEVNNSIQGLLTALITRTPPTIGGRPIGGI